MSSAAIRDRRELLAERLVRLNELLVREELDALLVVASSAEDPDLAPFVGGAHLGSSFFLAGPAVEAASLGYLTSMERDEAAASGLALSTPEALGVAGLSKSAASSAELWSELLERAFAAAGVSPCRTGLAGRYPAGTVHAACSRLESAGWSFSPAHELLRELRKAKTDEEIGAIRLAARATRRAMRRVASLLAASRPREGGLEIEGEPLSAGMLRDEIRGVFAAAGLEQPKGNIVACGREAGVPHTQGSSERRLRAGESIVVDLYPRGRLFADCTRTFCVGEAPEPLRRAHRAVRAALELAHEQARPGATGWQLQQQTCRTLGELGYPTPISDPETTRGYVHGLGHGVGLELHEYPSFREGRGESGRLAQGDVFTLEPGLYDPEVGYGVRLEDLCYLGPSGLENLTDLPYDLNPLDWQPAS